MFLEQRTTAVELVEKGYQRNDLILHDTGNERVKDAIFSFYLAILIVEEVTAHGGTVLEQSGEPSMRYDVFPKLILRADGCRKFIHLFDWHIEH